MQYKEEMNKRTGNVAYLQHTKSNTVHEVVQGRGLCLWMEWFRQYIIVKWGVSGKKTKLWYFRSWAIWGWSTGLKRPLGKILFQNSARGAGEKILLQMLKEKKRRWCKAESQWAFTWRDEAQLSSLSQNMAVKFSRQPLRHVFSVTVHVIVFYYNNSFWFCLMKWIKWLEFVKRLLYCRRRPPSLQWKVYADWPQMCLHALAP